MANAVAPTSGTIVGVHRRRCRPRRPPGHRRRPAGSAATLWFAGGCYAGGGPARHPAGQEPARPGSDRRGPGPGTASVASELRDVFVGLVDGLKHLNQRRKAAYALGAVAVHRALYGTLLVEALLLYRNYFYSGGNGNKALGSVTLLVITSAIGFGLAAVVDAARASSGSPRTSGSPSGCSSAAW